MDETKLKDAARLIKNATHLTAFTGAGISVESGIPPFRGDGGLWNKYDPKFLYLQWFLEHPEESWGILNEVVSGQRRVSIPIRHNRER